MANSLTIVLKSIVWGGAVGTCLCVGASHAEAQVGSTPVRVVNTPLPITGTVTVAGGTSGGILAPTKASDLVTLRSSGASCYGIAGIKMLDLRSGLDGTQTPFSIPAGKVLIVTSMDWRQGITGAAGKQEEVFLYASATTIAPPVVDSLAPGSSDGRAGAIVAVTGVAIGPGNPCWQVNSANFGSADVILHGFLAKDE